MPDPSGHDGDAQTRGGDPRAGDAPPPLRTDLVVERHMRIKAALLLGLLLASSTIAVGGQSDDPFSGQSWFFFAPLVIPLVILGVPLLDTAFAIIRRASRRSGVATADKAHLHHRLMDLGHGHRRAVAILWAWTALLSAFVLVPVYTDRGNGIVPLGLLALGLLLFTAFAPRLGEMRARS